LEHWTGKYKVQGNEDEDAQGQLAIMIIIIIIIIIINTTDLRGRVVNIAAVRISDWPYSDVSWFSSVPVG
jgi:hypothetical protein